ncbi:MAG: N-acetyl-gamma-glutamyl-phosphate reductase [Coriobacteriia bacterium]|nr:N-acetyl-gamma-glutamyl-phosphate reductase [Coriobacteriia bacterium]
MAIMTSQAKLSVGIIGASGYTGHELIRILTNHPEVSLCAISSRSYEGKKISELYPNFRSICDMSLTNQEEVLARADLIFAGLPHGLSEPLAHEALLQGKYFIDLGADFRLQEESHYLAYYKKNFEYKELHTKAVYGLPELYASDIRQAKLIANPGCFPTAATLGLYPALQKLKLKSAEIIIDAKTGTTGAGRSLSQAQHFAEHTGNFYPYSFGTHRHTPEIEEQASAFAQEQIQVCFIPHLLPISRGILNTMYLKVGEDFSLEDLHSSYKAFYQDKHFVRVLDLDERAAIAPVANSNYCDISLHFDAHNKYLIICAAIDNMLKGSSGQAVQNMNIMMNFDETAGLDFIPSAF